jgi:hypothetical protein
MRAAVTKVKASAHASRGNEQQENHGHTDRSIAAELSPVHGLLQAAAARLEAKGLLIQTIRLVHEEFNLFTALQYLWMIEAVQS